MGAFGSGGRSRLLSLEEKMNDLDWYYNEAKDWTQSIGGQAKDAVEEVYSDASEAGGFVLDTIGQVVTAPGKMLQSIGKGVEKAGGGLGDGAKKAGEGAGAAAIALVAGAVLVAYLVSKK